MIDAEYAVSSLFFIVCLVLLNFWLMNIFVAVIINTFGNIREETKSSAFAGKTQAVTMADTKADPQGKRRQKTIYLWRKAYNKAQYAWVGVIIADVGVQASKTSSDTSHRIIFLNSMELYFTLAFLVEIVARFMSYLPDYRAFFRRSSNIADSSLVLITCIIQIPFIRDSGVYPWLTVFQLMRFYRVVLAIPRMKPLLVGFLTLRPLSKLMLQIGQIAKQCHRPHQYDTFPAFDEFHCRRDRKLG